MFKKIFNPVLLLITISILAHSNWFFDNSILTSSDWNYYFSETQRDFFSLPYSWLGDSFGRINLTASMYPINLMWGIFSFFTNFGVTERILYLIPSLIISTLGSYFLLKRITASQIGALIGATVFSFNTYFLIIQTAHLTVMMGFALAPVVIYFFIKSLEKLSIPSAIITGLILLILSYYDFRIFYIMLGVMSLYLFFYILFISPRSNFKESVSHIKYLILPLIIVILGNMFWIIGLGSLQVLSSNQLFSRGLFGNEFLNIVRAFALFHPFWTGTKFENFVIQQIPVYFFITPIVAYTGFILNRKNVNVIFFALISIIGILLSKQVDEPFSGLYLWLYNNFPGFNAFREASKFYFLIILGYSVLIAFFVSSILKVDNTRISKFFKYTICIGIALIFLMNIKPFYTAEVERLSIERFVPDSYNNLKNYLIDESEFSRTFWIPLKQRYGFVSDIHPAASLASTIWNEWSQFQPDTYSYDAILKLPYAKSLLNFGSVKYVILPSDTENEIFMYYGGYSPTYYKDLVDDLNLKIVSSDGGLTVWENDTNKPHLYIASNTILVTGKPTDFSGIDLHLNDAYLFSESEIKPKHFNYIDNKEINPFAIENIIVSKGRIEPKLEYNNLKSYDLLTKMGDNVITQEFNDLTKLEFVSDRISDNLYKDGSFDSKQIYIGDCNNSNKSSLVTNGISGAIIKELPANNFLQIRASKHIACLRQNLDNFDKNSNYYLSLDYKHISGPPPQVSFYPRATEPLSKPENIDIDADNEWHNYTKLLKHGDFVDETSFYIYLPTDGVTESITNIDNVKIYKIPELPSKYLRSTNEASGNLEQFNKYHNPTKSEVLVNGLKEPRLIVFSDSYHPDWQAFIRKTNSSRSSWWKGLFKQQGFQIPDEDHVIANGFVNGWWLNPDELPEDIKNEQGEYQIVVEFGPQKYFYLGFIVSVFTVLSCIIFLIYNFSKKYRGNNYA